MCTEGALDAEGEACPDVQAAPGSREVEPSFVGAGSWHPELELPQEKTLGILGQKPTLTCGIESFHVLCVCGCILFEPLTLPFQFETTGRIK